MKSYIVIGLGRFGGSLARQLCTLGAEVLAMDVHNDLVQQLANDVTHAVVGDARDKEVLRALGVRNFDCAVIAIGDDLAASVLITMNLKELGAPYIVCKAHDETHRLVQALRYAAGINDSIAHNLLSICYSIAIILLILGFRKGIYSSEISQV